MAEKSAKKKPKKAGEPGVLGSLPSTRPTRLGRARPGSDEGAATATKPKAATKPSQRAKKSSQRATKPSQRAKRSSQRATSKPSPRATATPPRPSTTSSPPPSDGRRSGPPSGIELVKTGAQATGELARIGLTVGGQMLKRAARRLPRP